ncbi:MAG: hypothetical protein ABI702_02225 [Burkholderiales bacterium]
MKSTIQTRWVPLLSGLACLLSCGHAVASWATKCATSKYVCVEISVSSQDGTITLDHEPVYLSLSPPTVVIWKLPEGYVFNRGGAGVAVPHQGEVTEAGGSDDEEGATGQLTKRYRIKAKRLLQDQYKYSITFHEMNGGKPTRRFFCDPRIANSGGFTDKSPTKARSASAVATSAPITCTVTNEP